MIVGIYVLYFPFPSFFS